MATIVNAVLFVLFKTDEI